MFMAVLWLIGAGIQIGLGATADDKFTTIVCSALAGMSIGLSIIYFAREFTKDA